ncbi:MAG: hypothetical protein IKZ53_03535 [Selenomonadaceae bacterium]|nr:hypothetical protein [Selenomonadaceae bacterium]
MAKDKGRIYSLDMLRGFFVATIFFFDAPPSNMYPILMHSAWEGFTLAEFGFPLFAFIMGVSMAISLSRRNPPLKRLLTRVSIIFALGIFLGTLPHIFSLMFVENFTWSNFYDAAIVHGRLFGVFQRLALTYLFAVLIVRTIKNDVKIFMAAFVLLALSSAGYHIYSPENSFAIEHNISRAVDFIFPGANHIYLTTHDPEGLYGTIAGTASVIFGYLAGRILIDNANLRDRIFLMTAVGVVLLIAGGIWSFGDIICKNLWTTPYALINAGVDFIWLAIFMKLFDEGFRMRKIYQLMTAFGRNPLFFFFTNSVIVLFLFIMPIGDTNLYFWIYRHTTAGIISPEFGTTLFCLLWTLIWFPVAELFHRFNIVIKI